MWTFQRSIVILTNLVTISTKLYRTSACAIQRNCSVEISVYLFYDVTTLYFEADYEDELRKTGLSKEGRHSNPQIILGLLVSLGGYPLAYCIHDGNKYEGHTMLSTINEFVSKYGLENFVIMTDSGLMNNANIAELEVHGYKYIIGAKIKNESQEVKNWILEQPKQDCQMVEYDKGRDVVSWSAIPKIVQRKMITTIQIKLPLNKDVYTQTMLMARHQKIAKLFDEDFWVTQ